MAFTSSKRTHQSDGVTARYVLHLFFRQVRKHKLSGFLVLGGMIVSSVTGIWAPIYYRKFFDILTSGAAPISVTPALISILVLVLGINFIGWLSYRFASFANAHFLPSVMADLKQDAYDYMLEHSYTFFSNSFTGSLVQRVGRLARAFENLSDRLAFNIIPLVIQIGGTAIVLYFVNHTITYVLVTWMILFLGINYVFARWKLKYDIRGAEMDSKSTAVLADTISNQTTVQLFDGFSTERKNYFDVSREQRNMTRFRWSLDSTMDAVQALFVVAMEFILYYFALQYWKDGLITIGVFVLIEIYFVTLLGRLWDFSHVVRDVYQSFADAKEMAEIIAKPHDIEDLPTAKPLVVSKGEIRFKELLFSYNQTRTVLDKINLTIPSGQRVALIWPSGAGKSTFIRLLLRFYDPTGGKILIDGQDIEHVTQASLRNNISLVPQDPLLFHRTLLENIRYGRREASNDEVIEAARLAHCDEFAKDLPYGYDTFVGERGIKLSGGERQRVAIARAILKNAPILLLDEATSSLDSHSESLIQEALDTLMKGKTVLVIAHRLSTIRKMDRILVLDQGHITESGSHDELLAQDGSLYKKLWTLQSGGFLQEDEEKQTAL